MTQISTSVQSITEAVVSKQSATTLKAASHVRVNWDTPETDSTALVSHLKVYCLQCCEHTC